MKRAIVFGSAPVADWSFLKDYQQPGDLIICADGGRRAAEALGLTPDWYVGDNDSGGYAGSTPADLLPSEKDVTDLDMAVSRAIAEGVKEIIICGCTGGREDHHLSAFGQLERIHALGAEGILVDPCNEVRLLCPGTTVVPSAPAFRYFGIVPLDAVLTGVTIRGAKYETDQVKLLRTASLGISNQALEGEVCTISYASGTGLLIRSERL